MPSRNVVLKVVCREPNGPILRNIYLAELTIERLKYYYERLKKFKWIFNNFMKDDLDSFIRTFISQSRLTGDVVANGLVWEVDDVGLLGLSDIIPKHDATLHFSFWDRRTKGREVLLREFVKYVFRVFEFNRLSAEVPLYAAPWLPMIYEAAGFVAEGRKRKDAFYEGQWFDTRMLSVLREEALKSASKEA